MKRIVFLYLLVIIFITACIEKPRTKLFIKSLKVSEEVRIDWYVHSYIGSFAPDFLQINTHDKKPFFVSYYLTGIHFKNDSLYISLWKNSYEKLDVSELNGINVLIDTTGESWNGGSRRFGRLKRVGVNVEAPHFVDAYCPNGECYNFDTTPSYR